MKLITIPRFSDGVESPPPSGNVLLTEAGEELLTENNEQLLTEA